MAINPVGVQFTGDGAAFFAELGKVRRDLGGLNTEAARIGNAFRSVGNVIKGYIGFRTVTSIIRNVVQATAAQEAAQAQLDSALASTNANVKAASAELQAYASELQRTTTFGDEAIIGVQSLLLSFKGLSGDTIKRATASVLDLSARMGIDAPAAAKLLGKALADPIGGLGTLSRSGVIFTDQQKDQIKVLQESGRSIEAQTLILDSLQKSFGGAAAAAKNTFGGALAGLKNAFGDLFEGKGGINDASASINQLTDTLSSSEVQEGFANLVSGIATAISKVAELGAAIASLTTGIGEFFGRLNSGELAPEFLESVEDVDSSIRRLQRSRREAEAAFFQGPVSGEAGKRAEAQLEQGMADIDKQLARLEQRRREIQDASRVVLDLDAAGAAAKGGALNFTTGGEPTDEENEAARKDREKAEEAEYLRQYELRSEYHDAIAALDAEAAAVADEIAARQLENFFLDTEAEMQAAREAAEERLRIEQDLQERITDLRAGAVNAGIGLLQLLAGRSKTAAKALILVNRGLAIAQAVQNTAAAATKALAIYGPTPAGFAAAAAAKAFGAIQIGLIAATGALEIAAVNSGQGASVVGPGTPNNPIYTRENDEPAGVTPQESTRIIIYGNIYGFDDFQDKVVDALGSAVNERDVVPIRKGSRQALELQKAA